jgi:isocitrate dehydrogenase (NAD+)
MNTDPQLYGAICGNIGSALVGGPGVVPGCNFGREYALFEPGCRHVGKVRCLFRTDLLGPPNLQDIMGTNKANPTALILSATMMLRHLGLDTQANAIAEATYGLVSEGKVRTADIGGGSLCAVYEWS